MAKEPAPREVRVTIEVLLKDCHPAIAEHSGYFCKQLGELLLRKTGEEKIRQEIMGTLGLPTDAPFKLTIHAAHAGHGDYRRAVEARGQG